jgi:hypothetical protein
MASLADLNLPSNIVYDERTKRYHDMLQNYRMVSGARVAAMGTPQRADRPDQYVTRQEFLNLRADLFRFVSHTTELTREALQALFEMQRAQLRDTERLRDYELDNRENAAEGRSSLLGRLASGGMERVGNVVRARPGLSLAAILGGSILGFAAIPNESVARFGAAVDEIIGAISNITNILGQIAAAAAGLTVAEIARRALQRPNIRPPAGQPNRPTPGGQPRPSIPGGQPNRPTPGSGGQPNRPTPSGQPRSSGLRNMFRTAGEALLNPRRRIPGLNLLDPTSLEAGAEYEREQLRLARRTPTEERTEMEQQLGEAGNQRPPQARTAEQRLRDRAANTPPGSPERRALARSEAQNMIRTAEQENRLTPQQAQALTFEMGSGGRYQNQHEEITRILRQGGSLEISPDVARRLNLPQQIVNTEAGEVRLPAGAIQVLPPVNILNRNQLQSTPQPRQQAQNMIRIAQQENRLTPQQAQAITIEMRSGGRYQNRHEEVATTLRQGGSLEISPEVARRLNLPQQIVSTEIGEARLPPGAIQVLPPINIPNRNQSQPAPQPRQQAQTPVTGLQIRNPEHAMLEALTQHMLPS